MRRERGLQGLTWILWEKRYGLGRSEQGRVISREKRERGGEASHGFGLADESRDGARSVSRGGGDRQVDVGGRVCVVCAQCQSSVSRVVWERSDKKRAARRKAFFPDTDRAK